MVLFFKIYPIYQTGLIPEQIQAMAQILPIPPIQKCSVIVGVSFQIEKGKEQCFNQTGSEQLHNTSPIVV